MNVVLKLRELSAYRQKYTMPERLGSKCKRVKFKEFSVKRFCKLEYKAIKLH